MWFELRKEDLGFRQRAPIVHVADAELAVPRARVFAAFADPTTWPLWFPSVREVSYSGPTPPGVGTIRQALVGGTRWVEEMIAWDVDRCWAYSIVRSSVPMAWAKVEAFELEEARQGTRVRWTLALEPRLLARLGSPFFPAVVDRLFARAMRNLESLLRSAP